MVNSKKENKIIFICWLAYVVAYVGRLNYNASIVAIISDMGITKAAAGLVGSFFFFAYGIGQFVNGIMSKRYNSRLMVFLSLFISACLNIIMPMCGSISAMKYIWLLNGAVQSVLWSTLLKTISEFISDKKMPTAIMIMSTPNTFGTFIVYGLSALMVRTATWRVTFYIAAGMLFITAFVWYFIYGNDKPQIVLEKSSSSGSRSKYGTALVLSMAVIAFAGIANGFIKDGINTWVPNVLYEEFGVSQSMSILLTLLLPLVATLSAGVIKKIHEHIESHSGMNSLLFAVSALLCGGIMLFLRIKSIVFIMACFIIASAVMAMINNVITSMFPLDRRYLLGSGFAGGLLNTFCYVGSTITSYSLGAVSQRSGWNSVFVIMLVVSLAAFAVSAVGTGFDKKLSKAGIINEQ